MHRVPDRIHPWNLIGEEFQKVENARDAYYPGIAQDFEGLLLRCQCDPVEMDRQPSGKDSKVKIDAGQRSETERDGEQVHPFHGEQLYDGVKRLKELQH